jgi:hypothetical protein
VREPADSELTPEESKQRELRQAVMAEFLRRIDDEFREKRARASSGSDEEEEDPYNLFDGKSWKGE